MYKKMMNNMEFSQIEELNLNAKNTRLSEQIHI